MMNFIIEKKKLNFILSVWLDKALYFITGLMAFSAISFYLTRVKLGLPFYLPELLLIPLLVVKHKMVRLYIKQLLKGLLVNAKLIPWLMFWILLVLLGYIFTNDIFAVLSSGRAILYIILLAYLFSRSRTVSYNFLFYISFGAVVGDLLNSFFHFGMYQMGDPRSITSANIIAVSLCISIPIIYRKFLLQIITTLIVIMLIINCGFRIVLIVAVISFIFSHFALLIHHNYKQTILNVIYLLIICFIISNFVTYFINLYGITDYRYFRLVTRSENLLKRNIVASADESRVKKMNLIWETILSEKILPHGFISEGKGLVGLHNDVPIVFLYDTIGSALSIVLLIWILFRGGRFAMHEMKQPTFSTDTSVAIAFIVCILLLFTNGRFLYITYESWLFGIILGRFLQNRIV